jgi:hydrogen cyanide synthase HcnC
MPFENIRQTDEGTVMIGDSQQDAGLDDRVEPAVTAAMAARALRIFPFLRDARVVRTWAALRVLSSDGFPVYAQSARHPGAFVVTCHSGVTLAAAHALLLAPMIAAGALASSVSAFAADRFDVRTTA